MYGTKEALKTNLEMKYADGDYPTNSASSDMETDSYEDQSSQSDIVSGDEDCPSVIVLTNTSRRKMRTESQR